MRHRVAAIGLVAVAFSGASAAPGAEARVSWVLHAAGGSSLRTLEHVVAAAGGRVTGTAPSLGLLEVEASPRSVDVLRGSPLVGWVHRERTLSLAGARPNDPLFASQWPLRTMDAVRGWRVEKGAGADVIVAVIDTGVDYSHPDLQHRMLPGFDFVNRDDDPADDHGHGTHVSGIVAAEPDNRLGIAGVSWGASIMPLKACAPEAGCGTYDVAAAIAFAIHGGAKVVNMSLAGGTGSCLPEFRLAAALAEARDVLLVAATGNSAQDGNPVMYPAACEGFLGVGATAQGDRWAPFSEHGDYVDVSAPGVRVPSTLPPGLAPMPDDPVTPGYGAADGTSMAAPHVAGLAALLFARHPEWTPLQVEEHLEETAVDLGPRGPDEFFGAGRVSIGRALGAS